METGLERFIQSEYKAFRKKRIGVLCNQASLDQRRRHVTHLLTQKKLGLEIKYFFGPQHGLFGEKQDDMVESSDFIDAATQIPVISLYSETRRPPKEKMEDLDVLIVDLQEIGSRVYTFSYTMANCMQVARETGTQVLVLDRPNPINGTDLEGHVLEPSCASFVGQYPIPVRHGMTIGELAQLYNEAFEIQCDLKVLPMRRWNRKKYYDEFPDRPWIPPSPNIPTLEAACVFSGMVFFEGTHVSEGRGTTKPFEVVGAPYIKADALAREMNAMKLPGIHFQPYHFQPMFQKHRDHVCGGVYLHLLDRKKFKPYKTGLALLSQIYSMYPDEFEWKPPPYEYEYERMPIDLIAGTSQLRKDLNAGKSLKAFEDKAKNQLARFRRTRQKYLLY